MRRIVIHLGINQIGAVGKHRPHELAHPRRLRSRS
jgi:hypothetical protein